MLNQNALTALAADVDLFERVWSRMTAAECVRICTARGYITGTPVVPTDHTAEGAISWLDWNAGNGSWVSTSPYRYHGGVFAASRRGYQVRALLKTDFVADRAGWLDQATASDDQRALALVVARPPSPALGAGAPLEVFMWNATQYQAALGAYPDLDARANLIKPVQVFYNQNAVGWDQLDVNYVASELAARPAGRRWLQCGDYSGSFGPLWGIPVDLGGGVKRYAYRELEFTDTTRGGISLETWKTQIQASGNKLRTFLAALKAQGVTLLGGDGTSILTAVLTDLERLYKFWRLQYAVDTAGGEDFADVMTDSYWASFRDNQLKPPLAQAVWDTVASWSYSTDERAFAFDAWRTKYFADALAIFFAVVREYFPAAVGVDYEARLHAPATNFVAVAAENFHHPYGTAGAILGMSACELYGAHSGGRWYWPTLATQYTGDRYNVSGVNDTANTITVAGAPFTTATRVCFSGTMPTGLTAYQSYYARDIGGGAYTLHPTASDATNNTNVIDFTGTGSGLGAINAGKDEWNALVTQIIGLRSVLGATTGAAFMWVCTESDTQSRLGAGGLWAEMVLHASLTGHRIGYYQPSGTADEHKKLVDLVAERDGVVDFDETVERMPPLDYTPALLATPIFAGERRVWRVTPNPNVVTTVSVVGTTITFSNSLGSQTFTHAALHASSQSAIAPLGYWVEQSSPQQALFCQWGGAYAGAEAGQAA